MEGGFRCVGVKFNPSNKLTTSGKEIKLHTHLDWKPL